MQDEPRSFVFCSQGALEAERLLLLIHGSGVVRAGQWARRLIMNDDLDKGTQLPFIRRAAEEGYGIIVLNTNLNTVGAGKQATSIRENDSPEAHADYVWRKLVKKSKARHIAIIAHSYGGVVTTDLIMNYLPDFQQKVFAIAFTDSVHSLSLQKAKKSVSMFYQQRARNWVSASSPLDTPVTYPGHRPDAPLVSAGHPKHEWTSCSSMESIFHFLQERCPSTDSKAEF